MSGGRDRLRTIRARTTAASRQMAGLFLFSGLLAFVSAGAAVDSAPALLEVGLASVATAALITALPWSRWPASASLVLVIPAFGIVAASSALELIPPRTYGLFFVLIYVWLALHHRRRWAYGILPVAAIAYTAPLVLIDVDPPFSPEALTMAMITWVMLAEIISRSQDTASEAIRASEHAVDGFRTVARTSAALREVDPDSLLGAVSDAVIDLGYDGANLSIFDPATDTFEIVHARGIATAWMGPRYPASRGLTARVRDTRAAVVVRDYQSAADAIPGIKASGVRLAIGAPVLAGPDMAAVLVASRLAADTVAPQDMDILQVLADVAGASLVAARAYQAQVEATRTQAIAAATDELTGLPNRREAERLLERIRPGDSLVMVDLDHFRQVNEALGHGGGDRVLREFADHLARGVREWDRVARFGGEEFVVILPASTEEAAVAVMERIMETWRAGAPATTFSAGIATHCEGRSVAATLAAADATMYQAKHAGRDTFRAESSPVAPNHAGL